MKHLEKLTKYLDEKLIQYKIEEGIIKINDTSYSLVDESETIFDEDMEFEPRTDLEVDGMIYEFAGRWYTQSIEFGQLELIELIYKGDAKQKLPTKSFLGIRSGFELGNGIGNYSTYIKKAKFLGTESLGICEKNTLAGALNFQKECISNGIKSIIGMTISVQGESCIYDAKVYQCRRKEHYRDRCNRLL